MAVTELNRIRDRVMPMFDVVVDEYAHRTPAGYPEILDDADRGVVGLLLDPSFSIHFVSDGTGLFVDMTLALLAHRCSLERQPREVLRYALQ